jgi:hypothetical protein
MSVHRIYYYIARQNTVSARDWVPSFLSSADCMSDFEKSCRLGYAEVPHAASLSVGGR